MSEKYQSKLIAGTRGSDLALAQANNTVNLLRAEWPDVEFVIKKMKTAGDRFSDAAIENIGVGVFTKEIEQELLREGIDLAIHSLKDLPTRQPEGLVLASVLKREDPRDALVSKHGLKLSELPEGAKIGTSSIRRKSQLLAYRPDLDIVPFRGNVPTRLRRLGVMPLDAIVLAAAGLKRLGMDDSITEYIEPDIMLPSPGQGALALETRIRDNETIDIVRKLEDEQSRTEVLAERQLLELLGGGCQAPIGVLAEVREDAISLRAVVASGDGKQVLRAQAQGQTGDWRGVTWKVAQELKKSGASQILEETRSGS